MTLEGFSSKQTTRPSIVTRIDSTHWRQTVVTTFQYVLTGYCSRRQVHWKPSNTQLQQTHHGSKVNEYTARHQTQLAYYRITNSTRTRPLANVLEIMNVYHAWPTRHVETCFSVSPFPFPSHLQPTIHNNLILTHIQSYLFHFYP